MSGVAYYFSLGGKIEAGLTTLFAWEENVAELGVGGSSIPTKKNHRSSTGGFQKHNVKLEFSLFIPFP